MKEHFLEYNKTKINFDPDSYKAPFNKGEEKICFMHYHDFPDKYSEPIINPWNSDVKIEIDANKEEAEKLINFLFQLYKENKTVDQAIDAIKEMQIYTVSVKKALSIIRYQ